MIAHFMLCNPFPSYQPLGLRLAHYYSNFYEHVWSNTKPFTGHFNLAIIYFGLCTYFTFFTFSSMSQQEQMLYGITPAGLSPGLGITPHHTGQPGVSSQLLPGTPRLWCLAVMTPPFYHPCGILCCLWHPSPAMAVIFLCRGGTEGLWFCSVHAGLLVIYRTMHEQGSAGLAAPQAHSPRQQLTSHGICNLLLPPVLKLPQLWVWRVLKLPEFLLCWTSPLQVNTRRGILHSAPLKLKLFLLILLHLGPIMLAHTDKDILSW